MFMFAAGYRIVTAFTPGMTADDAAKRQPAPLQSSKPLNRLLCITAAGRLISAGGWKIRRNSNPVYFNQKKQQTFKYGINHVYLPWITALASERICKPGNAVQVLDNIGFHPFVMRISASGRKNQVQFNHPFRLFSLILRGSIHHAVIKKNKRQTR